MAYDGWLTYGGVELVNLSRTVQLAQTLGINTLAFTPEDVAWIETALGGTDYDDITEAPWYDSGVPASMEFAGIVSLGVPGLDDSTYEASTTEYISDGGNSNRGRNATLPLVASMALIASTDRGADFGNRWLARVLRGSGTRMFCSGSDLRYFQFVPSEGVTAVQAHRRDVSLTRAPSITRKRSGDCAVTWTLTFTWTANDPFEYGEEVAQFTTLGGSVTGPGVVSSGTLSLVETPCPVYDYTPIYDPLYPALVAPPTAPNFFPDGWGIEPGMSFDRSWVRLAPVEPSALNLVPMLTLSTSTEARTIRVSIWPGDADTDEQCDPLFAVVVTYLPISGAMYIDGEQQAAYVWDGVSPLVRRTDSLVYAPDASPVEWAGFNSPDGLLVALDTFTPAGDFVRAGLSLIPKSD